MRYGVAFLALVAVGAVVWYFTQPDGDAHRSAARLPDGALAVVKVPGSFTDQERMGQRGYDAACASCHGPNAQGRDGIAPPLVHKIYEPGHHGDLAFVLAVQNGVRGHHWRFGNMPPVKGVTRADVLNVVAYVRALQRENGIN